MKRKGAFFCFRSLFVVCLFTALGCVSATRLYPGPALPDDKVANLTFYEPIRVTAVDGTTGPFAYGILQVLPGLHTVSVKLFACNYGSGRCDTSETALTLPFDAHAGRNYSIEYSRTGNSWNAWIEEKGSE
ncbi:MAG TPA: hypothetical protein VF790_05795 [Dissulfurispiraceae bacterium]